MLWQKTVKQAHYYNCHNGARVLSTLIPGDKVLSKLDNGKLWTSPAVVTNESMIPRSYFTETEEGTILRRNRQHLQAVPWSDTTQVSIPEQPPETSPSTEAGLPAQNESGSSEPEKLVQTRSGRASKLPKR